MNEQVLRQTADEPLFPDLLWSKPENKNLAGKVLIIGGNSFGFAAVGEAYERAIRAGAGEVRVLLPNAIQKIVGGVFEHALFAASNPSGSFSKDALTACLEAAEWADGVLIVGDVSRNAETAALLELFVEKFNGPLALTKDALELVLKQSPAVAQKDQATLIMTMADLQQLAKQLQFQEALTFELTNEAFTQRLLKLSADIATHIIVKRNEFIYVTSNGELSVTKLANADEPWRVATATKAIIWQLQHPGKTFEALTSAII